MAAPLQQPISDSEHSIPLLHPFVKPALLLTCSRWTLVQRPRGSIVTLAKGVFYSFRRWPLPSEQRTRVRCEHEVSSTPFLLVRHFGGGNPCGCPYSWARRSLR